MSEREPCPDCGSKDNVQVFADGSRHCFTPDCGYHRNGDGPVTPKVEGDWKQLRGKVVELTARRISKDVARLYGYQSAQTPDGKRLEIENYYQDGAVVAQHIRHFPKDFRWRGNAKAAGFFGQHLFGGGKRVIITEGAVDAMSIQQAYWPKSWPVVSVPSGAASAAATCRAQLEWLCLFDEVVLCLDNDEPGRKATQECADIIPGGRVRLATTPRKDANAHLVAGDTKALLSSLWQAKTYSPDGILHVSEVAAQERPKQAFWLYPWTEMNTQLYGQRSGEITMWTSGTGMGKSTAIRQLYLEHLLQGRKVAMLMLEESPTETLDDMIGLILNKQVRQIRAARRMNEQLIFQGREAVQFDVVDDLTDEEYAEGEHQLQSLGLYIFDHRGDSSLDKITSRVEYMSTSLGCELVTLDHITAAVAGMTSRNKGNERLDIDHLLKDLRSIVERTGLHLDIVSQLRKSDGKAYEEGGRITLQDLRGSGSLSSVPNTVLAFERNQQATDPALARTMLVRSLKDRFQGRTGPVAALQYDRGTGQLESVPFFIDEDGRLSLTPKEEPVDRIPNQPVALGI